GTTFAWFTDSVTSSNNIIQTGTLDVSLEYSDEVLTDVNDAKWADASKGAIFNYSNWEPGYTAVKYVKIENEGSLDLKFTLSIIPNGEAGEVNLADVIEVYMVSGATTVERSALTPDSAYYVGNLTSLMNDKDGAAHGVLYADDADKAGNVYEVYTIALKMSTSAGNEYMGKNVGGGFAVQLLATQLASESDSFNNEYDKDATYTISVNSTNELVSSFENMTEATVFDATGVSIDVDTVGTTTDEIIVPIFSIPTGATVKGAEFKIESASMISAEKTAVSDTVIFDECAIVTAGDGMHAMALVGEMGTTVSSTKYVFNNCTFKGYVMLNGINAEFNNCTFVLSDENDGATWCSFGEYDFNNCTFNYKNGANLIAAYTIYADSYATVVLKNCTLVGATYGNSAGSTITVE
ncbi:MAG: hypothetical protein E7381_04440, partial [Clostridiales bacterium]|nr:hypothetical protein [Clostridiales bacterium]